MFNNLIESSSHRSELRRRGSFFLFATVTYALLFVLAAVASIYAYDARLGEQDLELVILMSPVDFPVLQPHPPAHQPEAVNTNRNPRNFDERETPMVSVNRPDVEPKGVSTTANKALPIRDGVTTLVTGRDRNAELTTGSGSEHDSGAATPKTTIEVITPLPGPASKPAPQIIKASEILNGRAVSLPKPNYPQMGRLMHLQTKISVQVLIDETGKVISARAIDGHPLFRQVSETAAFQARFSPTKLGEQAVKVSGVITYNFVLQ